jgi:prevent-host-death family protein
MEDVMRKLSIRETRNSLSKLDELLDREKELVVTRRGKPVAKIVSLQRSEVPTHADLRAETARLARSSAELIREDRDRL